MKRFFAVLLVGAALGVTPAMAEEPVFQADEHCVAYRTVKTMFFFFDATVVGKSCQVTAAIDREGEGIRISASVPVVTFDSDFGPRDEHIPDILKAGEHPNITFAATLPGREELRKALEEGGVELPGQLTIAGTTREIIFPLALTRQGEGWLVEASIPATLADYGVVVDSVGLGGFIADDIKEITILVHLHLEQVEGSAILTQGLGINGG